MSSTSLRCFGVRINVFRVFVFTIFNVGLYGLYAMDIQREKIDVSLAPMRHYQAFIEKPEHQTNLDYSDYEQQELHRRLEPTIQSRSIEGVDIAQKTSKMDGFPQSIPNTQGPWSRSSRETFFGESKGQEDSKIPSDQTVWKKTLAIAKLSSKVQDSSLIKRTSSEKNSFQNIVILEKSYPKQENTSGEISLPKLHIPSKSSTKTFVTSSSRNRSTKKQLSLDKHTWQKLTSPGKNDSEKALSPGKNSFIKEPQLEMSNLQKRTALGIRGSATDVKSQADNVIGPVLLGDITKEKTARDDDQNDTAAAVSYNNVVKHPHNVTSNDIPNVYYGRKILSSNFSIVYNAVPKCGSRTIQVAVISLQKPKDENLKQFQNFPLQHNCSTDDVDSSCFYSFYTSMPPFFFVRPHWPYVSLPSNYVMINMIRDPLERFISLFFFRIYGDGEVAGFRAKDQTIDDCVQTGNKACDPLFIPSAMTFMCGVEPACRKATRWTLEKAKRNVDRYLVVGYLEDIDSMIKVLEVLVPNNLSGLHDQYVRKKTATRRFKTKQKEPLSPKTISILKQKLTLHYEFYNFIRAKFDHLKENLGIR